MAEPIVAIKNLSKTFEIRKRKRIAGIDATILSSISSLAQIVAFGGKDRGKVHRLVALDGIDLSVGRGDILGIIGRNGAGKSTLLKILARVVAPSKGRVRMTGRVASILELGLGFSPELTVLENIRLYGRLSGLPSDRVDGMLASILEFSGLSDYRERKLDACPSGSFVRLAFATMMAAEADVILADEILAVGDAAFRAQCEARVQHFAAEGGAVLFVSHDLAAIERICTRVAWIDKGRVRALGEPASVVADYRRSILEGTTLHAGDAETPARILDLSLMTREGATVGAVQLGSETRIACLVRADPPVTEVCVACQLFRGTQRICSSQSPPLQVDGATTSAVISLALPADFLNESLYRARLNLEFRTGADQRSVSVGLPTSIEFQAFNTDNQGSVWADWDWARPGLISPRLDWTVMDGARGSSS